MLRNDHGHTGDFDCNEAGSFYIDVWVEATTCFFQTKIAKYRVDFIVYDFPRRAEPHPIMQVTK